MKRWMLIALLPLAGCMTPSVYKDPVTGKVDQCKATTYKAFGTIGRSEIAECGAAFERMGWKKQ